MGSRRSRKAQQATRLEKRTRALQCHLRPADQPGKHKCKAGREEAGQKGHQDKDILIQVTTRAPQSPLRENATSSEDEEQEEQEGDEPLSPELSESEDEPEEASASKELPKEAATSAEERKEAPNYTPPSTPPGFNDSTSNEPKSSNVINSEHDSDIEEIETAEERKQRAFPNATAENMPKHSTLDQRQGWPNEWLRGWKRLEEQEAAADRAVQD